MLPTLVGKMTVSVNAEALLLAKSHLIKHDKQAVDKTASWWFAAYKAAKAGGDRLVVSNREKEVGEILSEDQVMENDENMVEDQLVIENKNTENDEEDVDFVNNEDDDEDDKGDNQDHKLVSDQVELQNSGGSQAVIEEQSSGVDQGDDTDHMNEVTENLSMEVQQSLDKIDNIGHSKKIALTSLETSKIRKNKKMKFSDDCSGSDLSDSE